MWKWFEIFKRKYELFETCENDLTFLEKNKRIILKKKKKKLMGDFWKEIRELIWKIW
jgi:hypothetical protein